MNEHIDATIEIVARKVKEMQDLLRGLHELRAGIPAAAERLHTEVPTLRSVALEVARAPKAAMPRVNGKPRPTGGGKVKSKSQGNPGLLLRTCAELPQPFTAEQVARAMHEKDVRKVASAISYHMRFSKKVVVVTAGKSGAAGTFRMANAPSVRDSEKTPNAAPLSAADNGDDVEVVPTGNANAIAELKHQLAEACKKRDRYRTNENETLMNIEQSRIDRLEGQIAALES